MKLKFFMLRLALPLLLFMGMLAVLWHGLYTDPKILPSTLIDHPVPEFKLPELFAPEKKIDSSIFLGKTSIVNVWASWCQACISEQELIRTVASDPKVQWIGFDYKDDPRQAKAWLKQYGNPYQTILNDANGLAALDWGIYGTPETFVIDGKGIIRYKEVGPITTLDWQNDFLPLLNQLEKENT